MQENTTYYDDTRYDNLTSLVSNGAKLAKLSALDRFKNNANKIKSELNSKVETEVASPEIQPPVEVTPEATSIEPTVESEATVEETKGEQPSKEVLESKTEGITFYNGLEMSSAESLGRKLRVAPQVTDSMKYALNTLGVEYAQELVETNEQDIENSQGELEETELDTSVENNELPNYELSTEENIPVETSEQNNKTFDFSALPGVGDGMNSFSEKPQVEAYDEQTENNDYQVEGEITQEEPTQYGDYTTTLEQDNRLNDYLNRETSNDSYSSSNTSADLEEIRRLKKEIEDARRSLQQVKGNVSDLQQKDNRISEKLAMLKQSLIDEKNAVNQEILAETTEWNNLTQIVREKEALMGDEEFSKNRTA